jgi:hypothetical protein
MVKLSLKGDAVIISWVLPPQIPSCTYTIDI